MLTQWHCGTRLVLPSVSEAVRSFETLGDANSVTHQHATEDLSQQNWCETLNVALDYCTMYSLHFESRTFTLYSLSQTHIGIYKYFFFVCGCFSLINELPFVLNIVYESQEVPVCVCVGGCVCAHLCPSVTACMPHPTHYYLFSSNSCSCMVGHILLNTSCPPILTKYYLPPSVKCLSHWVKLIFQHADSCCPHLGSVSIETDSWCTARWKGRPVERLGGVCFPRNTGVMWRKYQGLGDAIFKSCK